MTSDEPMQATLAGKAGSGEEFAFPASPAQEAFWFLEQLSPGNTALGIPVRFRLLGRLDDTVAREAMQAVLDRHEALRTTFATSSGTLEQVVHETMELSWRVVEVSGETAEERAAEAERIGGIEAHTPFDLVAGPLFRVLVARLSDDEAILHLTIHHAVCDGWSVGIIVDDFVEEYTARHRGRSAALPPLEIQFPDYAVWQKQRLAAGELDAQTEYWRKRLEGMEEMALLTDFRRPACKSWQGEILSRALPGALLGRVKALGDAEGASLFMVFLAVFATVLHRMTGQTDICIGSPVAGRTLPEVQRVVGVFINTLLYRIDFSGRPTFRELLRRVRGAVTEAMANQDVPYDHVVKAVAPERDLGRNPLTQVNFTHQRSFIPNRTFAGIELIDMPSCSYGTLFDLHVFTVEREGQWRVSCEFSTDVFRAETAEAMLGHFLTVLRAAVDGPDLPVGAISLVTPEEQARLAEWSGRVLPLPHSSVDANFAAMAARFAEKPALLADGFAMTYGELDAAASEAASVLRAHGLREGEPVGIMLPRSPQWVVAALAVLKAGGCYVPVDPAFPEERRALMVRETGLRFAAVGPAEDEVPRFEQVADPAPAQPRRLLDDASAASRPAYVMFTSGSTGEPKGVEITHAGILRLVHGQDDMEFSSEEVFGHLSTPSFDASTFEIWGALLHGGTVAIAPPSLESLEAIGSFLMRHRVTTLWLTASLFNQIMDDAPEILHGIRQLLTGGEALSLRHVQRALEVVPPGIRFVNGYGPTENTTFTCCYVIPRNFDFERATSIPIGRPITGTTIAILDESLQPVPVGVAGELCTGGLGLATCYLNHPDLTAQKFVVGAGGASRFYRTGDRARWLHDGTVEFLGRMDDQLKIRGFRIEPGEIEHQIERHPDVVRAAVIGRRTARGDMRLCAYVVPHREAVVNASELQKAIHRLLSATLPQFMVPSSITVVDYLPLTAQGKLDVKRLPEPSTGLEQTTGREPPATETEKSLAAIWQELLQSELVCRHDNFFALGGHSILALKLFVEIERVHQVKLPVATLFTCPTLSELAAEIDAKRSGAAGQSGILVPIRAGGREPPLFCIHAGDGGILFYKDFAQALDWDCPVYGVEAPWLVGMEVPGLDIPTVAAFYLEKIRSLQPEGSLHLAGFSFGGVVAFEAARQEMEAGREVAALILFDTANPANPPRRMTFAERMTRNLHESSALDAPGKVKYLAQRAFGKIGAQILKRREDEQAARARRMKSEGEMLPADLRVLNARRSSLEAMRAYRPGPYRGSMLLVTASELEPGWVFTPDLGWGGIVAPECLEIAPMPGKHHTILLQPHVTQAAAIVCRYLAKRNLASRRQ